MYGINVTFHIIDYMASVRISELLRIFKSSVNAVLPENLIRNCLNYNPISEVLTVYNENYNVSNKNIYLVGTGKAVQRMAMVTEDILKDKLNSGIVSIPSGSSINVTSSKIKYYEGAQNNLPDKNALQNTIKIRDLVLSLSENDLLIVLISGGGSALLTLPRKPITLTEKYDIIKRLANAGADIKELNVVRKKLSDIKGGKLALIAQPAQVISLVLSDIVGDPLDLIASGPTVKNSDISTAARDVLNKYNLYEHLLESLTQVLTEESQHQDFPEYNVKNYLIGSNSLSLQSAKAEVEKLNMVPLVLSNQIVGDVDTIAISYARVAFIFCQLLHKKIENEEALEQLKSYIPGLLLQKLDNIGNNSICVLLGGETTVNVTGTGKGGRNQQLALKFSYLLHYLRMFYAGIEVHFLSAGTDGIDGPTDAAGAIGYKNLVTDALAQDIDIMRYLDNNDSYNFYKLFSNGEYHVITGHTNTNVMDIHIMLITKNSNYCDDDDEAFMAQWLPLGNN